MTRRCVDLFEAMPMLISHCLKDKDSYRSSFKSIICHGSAFDIDAKGERLT